MNKLLRNDAETIIKYAIQAVQPDKAVRQTLQDYRPGKGRTILVAIGKAAWQMTKAAVDILGQVDAGIVITKYRHMKGEIPGVACYEAGHPVPDENSYAATEKALEMVKDLTADDTVIFLISGGGSALFELPLIPGEELQKITLQLLNSGANIVEINKIRKRLSGVKAGRFAQACAPAKVLSIVLSDVVGNRLDSISSGPAYPDASTCEEAKAVVEKYNIRLSEQAAALLENETPKQLDNVETHINGSVKELCVATAEAAKKLGYEPFILTDELCCEASAAGSFLASILKSHGNSDRSLAFIAGGETVVQVSGYGSGGRSQELALAAAPVIAGLSGTAVFSIDSDGTDGPTDAAGGYVDSETMEAFKEKELNLYSMLKENDSYHALEAVGGLIMTGPTGTNVNDVAVALLKK
ncbi:MAG: glycerate kinase [Acidaminococcaceae bacterium]|nr:glycerate kinase [Acidaminococcaceae bacterium]MBQ9634926.1 glycerate kinase [Acidaminococcaceae bacterium]